MRSESQALCLGTAETTVAGTSYWPAWNGCFWGLQKLQSFKQVTVVMWLVTMRGCRGLAVAKLAKGPPFPPSSISWGDSARDCWTGMLPCRARPNNPDFPAGLTEDEDIQAMLRGSRLLKIRSRTWHKERLYRLQEDGLSVWFQRRIPHAPSQHICEWVGGGAGQGAVDSRGRRGRYLTLPRS